MNKEEQIVLAKANYEKAQEAQAAAKKAVEDLKASQDPVAKAYEQAKAAFNALRPALDRAKALLDRANAEVKIAQGDLKALDPKALPTVEKGASNKAILEVVKKFLADKPNGATNQEIYDAVIAAGLELAGDKPRENFTSYLHRWGSAEALVSKGTGVWAVPGAAPPAGFLGGTDQAAAGTTDSTPPAPPAEVPAFLGGTTTPLTADFPGYEPLSAAGISTKEALAGKTMEDLTGISGIGEKTATKILEALAG